MIPMVCAAWLMGMGIGMIAWAVGVVLQIFLFQVVQVTQLDSFAMDGLLPRAGTALVLTLIVGQMHRLSYILKDELAERKKTEVALQQSESFIRRITEASSDIVYVYDLVQQQFVYSSRSLAHVLGYDIELSPEKEQSFLKRVMHPDDWLVLIAKPKQYRVAKDAEIINNEYRLRDNNGNWRWFYNRETIFLRDTDGAPRQIVGMSQDITERKQSAEILVEKEKLQLALDKEKELAQVKNRFMSLISHEFRTPLTVIQSSSELLENYFDRLSATRREECLSTIKTQVQYVNDMLNDISSVAAGEDHLEFKPVPTNLQTFCHRIADDLAMAKNRVVTFHSYGDLNDVPVDTKLLQHILTNLLTNAIKYSPDDQPVHLKVQREEDSVTFIVRDHGIGIPAEDRDRIFDTFYRAKNVGEVGGTGLGLRIVRDYVALHGGTVTMDSEFSQGSAFTISLPLTYNIPSHEATPSLDRVSAVD